MKRLILALTLALPLFAGDSLVLTSGDSLSYDPPNTTPWTALDTRRIEMAIDFTDWDCTGSTTSRLWGMGGDLYMGCGATPSLIYMKDGSGRIWTIDVSSRGESLIRLSRDVNGSITPVISPSDWMEIWDADGTNYDFAGTTAMQPQATPEQPTTEDASGSQTIGGTGIIAQIHWVKQYSTVLWPGPSSPLPGTLGTGDLGDWSFDGSTLTDSSGLGMTISGSGHTFETTPTINPTPSLAVTGLANWQDSPTVRAGEEVTLTGTCSTVASTLGCTCVWSDQGGGSGPTAIQFTGSTTSCTTTAVFPTFGPYVLRLAVTDNDANVRTRDFDVGAVAQDVNGSIVHKTDNIRLILGDQITMGKNPWVGHDWINQQIADWFGSELATNVNYQDYWNDAMTGTVSVSSVNKKTVTGTGTDFQNAFCGGGTTPVQQTSNGNYETGNWVFVIHNGANRHTWTISTCDSATQLTMVEDWLGATTSGLNYAKWGGAGEWIFASTNVGFYDSCMAYLSLYYRTGTQANLTTATDACNKWLTVPHVSNGNCAQGPKSTNGCAAVRTESLTGLMLWAEELEAQTTMWPSLANGVTRYNDGWCNDAYKGIGADPRDEGYSCGWQVLQAALDPDGTRAAAAATEAGLAFTSQYGLNPTLHRGPSGAYIASSGNTLGTNTVEVVNGSPTVTCGTVASPLSNCGFSSALLYRLFLPTENHDRDIYSQAAYELRIIGQTSTTLTLESNWAGSSLSGVNWRYSTSANTVGNFYAQPFIQSMPLSALIWEYRRGGGNYSSAIFEILQYFVDDAYRTDSGGFVYLTSNLCQYSPYPTIHPYNGVCGYNIGDVDGDEDAGRTASNSGTTVTIGVESLLSGTTLPAAGDRITITDTGETREIASITDATHLEVTSAFTYSFSGSTYDLWRNVQEDASINPRYLPQEVMGPLAEAYLIALDEGAPNAAAYYTLIDNVYGETWGKYGGPNSDGDYVYEIFDSTVGGTKWKNLGFGFGFGRNANWPSARMGGLAAETLVSYSVPLDIAGVSGATKASVTLYEPKGTVNRVVNDQTGSSASVTGDSRQGAHLAKIEYKNGSETILQTDYAMVSAPVGGDKSITGSATITGAISF